MKIELAPQDEDDRKPVPGTSLADLDRRRLVNYFRDLRQQDCPDPEDEAAWIRLLVNTEIMIESRGHAMASAAGLLLFGARPNRYLPQAGVSAAAYAGTEKDYDARERATVRGPAVSLAFQRTEADGTRYPRQPRSFSESSEFTEGGVIERPSTAYAGTPAWRPGSMPEGGGRSDGNTRWRRCGRRS